MKFINVIAMKIKLFIVTTLCFICASCNNDIFDFGMNSECNTRCSISDEWEIQKMREIIQMYNLIPLDSNEYTESDISGLAPISSAEQLQAILNQMNIVEYNSQIETEPHALTRIKTRAEIEDEQNVVAISGSNSNGKATVYVDVNTPAVVESTVQLGLIDAFLSYRHVSGSASRNGNKIDFIAYGEGMVKIIIEGIELYKYSTIIEGYCNSDGTGGKLTKF